MGNLGPLKSQGMPDGKGGRVHGAPLPSGIIESQGKPVTPPSLYLAQLAERLGPAALKNIGYTAADLAAERAKTDIPEGPQHMSAHANPSLKSVTITPAAPGSEGKRIGFRGPQFIAMNFNVNDLIAFAYGMHTAQIAGGPAWFATDLYDIEGIPDVEGMPSEKQQNMMLQKLLADRFQLKFHHERRKLPVFVITVAKGGPKMTKYVGSPDDPIGFDFGGLGDLTVQNLTMADFAAWFQRIVTDKPVVDRTRLTGRYDFTLRWTPDDSQFVQFRGSSALPTPRDNASPSLSVAFEEQLGLKLKSTKVPVDVIVIDQVQKPPLQH
jgi:uncharacterized protein (TIGR03435 family)